MFKPYIGLHVKYTLLVSDFNETWIFLMGFRKIFKYQIKIKIRQVGPEDFHTDRQTWRR